MKDKKIRSYLKNVKVKEFVYNNLSQSLLDIGFSSGLISGLKRDLENINPDTFGKKWHKELEEKYRIGFFQKYVPNYFKKHIVDVTPKVNKIIDIGCGTGILAKLYFKHTKTKNIEGIDINPYQEWKDFSNERTTFNVVKENKIVEYLAKQEPNLILITWTLHHMKYDEQERYVSYIYNALGKNAYLVLLEDSYSTSLKPNYGVKKCKAFMGLSVEERKKAMSVFDWVANRILAQRSKVPIPATYRTLEDWEHLFNKIGFATIKKNFIGFPNKRDINTPQSLIIFKKN